LNVKFLIIIIGTNLGIYNLKRVFKSVRNNLYFKEVNLIIKKNGLLKKHYILAILITH